MKIVIISGSVFGGATFHAQNIVQQLNYKGFTAYHLQNEEANLAQVLSFNADFYIFVSSTTNFGELPGNIMPLYQELRDNLPVQLRGKNCAIIGLGDSCYDDFCNSAVLLAELTLELGMQEIIPSLKLDACGDMSDPSHLVKKFIAQVIRNIS